MTKDQLIAKRKKKKRFRRITAVSAAAAVGLVLYGSFGLVRDKVFAMPGDFGMEELAEVEGIISLPEEPENQEVESAVEEGEEVFSEETPVEAESILPSVEVEEELPRWETTADGIFYYDEDGAMVTGYVTIDGGLYCFGYDGVMLTGWQEDDGNSYYFSPEDGMAVIGEQTIDGKTYWFDENGIMDPSRSKEPVEGSGPMVALTFDDGPGYYTDALLDLLASYDAKATFFMIGEEIENYPSAVLREYEMGMEQGNHSWDHKTLTHLSASEIEEEFQKTNDLLTEIRGGSVDLFRAPGGGLNDDVYANSLGMKSILWSIDTLDWETKNAQQTYDSVISQVQDGDIILMHEIYEATLDAAKEIIPKLKEMGFRMVTVSELAAARGIDMEAGVSYGSFYP